ncbi:MAG: hypothetical protein FD149_1818 [Rhodospirillaceae bacterium]|nr:MAG: hypothetical protein FD149_1818 [Rhodospirillaceae bacterium]
MARTETRPWDITESLDTPARIAAYLEAVFEDGDPTLIAAALGDVARARGMTDIARDTGLSQASLSRDLSPKGHPELATVLKVMRALGLHLSVTAEACVPHGTPDGSSGVPAAAP